MKKIKSLIVIFNILFLIPLAYSIESVQKYGQESVGLVGYFKLGSHNLSNEFLRAKKYFKHNKGQIKDYLKITFALVPFIAMACCIVSEVSSIENLQNTYLLSFPNIEQILVTGCDI